MNIKLHTVILLFCFGISLSSCSSKQYEVELLSSVHDASFAELDQSMNELSESSAALTEDEPKQVFYVHICGAVVNPGVYEVDSKSRIFEVLQLAGGFTPDAATDAVNLAMAVMDGSKIQIPTVLELETAIEASGQDWIFSADGAKAKHGSQPSELTGLVNINTADIDSLMALPGIGKAKAESIISYREEKGKFNTIEDIMNITGIKDAVFSKIKDRICV